MFKVRDRKTGSWITYGDSGEDLESEDRQVAEDMALECWDYGYEPEVIEVP
jgi:hypothetical protein